ncbi:MAG: DMT family transporter [Dehalococcoidales bacterium]|nr:DMT family transporter [Dehalococcoidales bacterium]
MKKQYLVLAVGVVCVSFAAVFIRLSEAPPLVIAAYRMCIAAIIILPVALVRSREEIRHLSLKNLLLIAAAGGFLALHFGLWIASLSHTSVATSVILVTASPIFVAVASYLLFREKITGKIIIGIVISISGAIVIGYSNWSLGPAPLLGAVQALLGALAITGYLLIGRRIRRDTGALTYSAVSYGSAAVCLLVATLIAGHDLSGYLTTTYTMFILLAIIPQLIGHSSLNWSLKFMPATMVTIAVLGEPVITTLLAFFILDETPAVIEIIGGVLILGGIYIAFRNREI